MALVDQEWFSADSTSGGLAEFHIQKLSDTNNDVFRERLISDFLPLSNNNKMWAQTFDLGDSVCICVVQGNQLEMSLVHLTSEPLTELRQRIERGDNHCVNLVPTQQRNQFIRDTTEASELDSKIQGAFQKFQHANLTFEAPIVPSISLKTIEKGGENLDSMCGRGPKSTQFRLSFATKSHKIYQVYFDRYFLMKNKTIFVEKSDDQLLKHLKQSHIKACECVQDSESGNDLFILGSSSYAAPAFDNEGGERRNAEVKSILNESLTFVTADRTVINPQHSHHNNQTRQNNSQNQQPGLMGSLAQGFRQKIGLEGAQTQQDTNVAEKLKVQQNTAILPSNMNIKNLEGVVTLKTLTNGLLVVVYSNAMIRIFQISNFKLLFERNLVSDVPVEGLTKVTEACISFNPEGVQLAANGLGFCKKIDIAVGLVGESGLSSSKKSIIDQFCLESHNLNVPFEALEDQIIGNMIPLSQNLEFAHQTRIELRQGLILSSISYENSLKQFIYASKDCKTRESKIHLTNEQFLIEDFTSKAKLEALYDKVDIGDKEKERFSDILKSHYASRILAPNRFSCGAIEELLQKENLNDLDNSMEENLLRNIQLTWVGNVCKFLENLKEIEVCNQDLLVIGDELSRLRGHRFLVRPLGISLLARTTKMAQFASSIRNQSAETSEDAKLISFLNLLASDLDQKVHLWDIILLKNENGLKDFAKQILRGSLSDNTKTQLAELVGRSQNSILLELQVFQKQVIRNVLEVYSFGGRKRHQMGEEQMSEVHQPSNFTLKLLEQKIINEIKSLSSCLKYAYLAQVFIGKSSNILMNVSDEVALECWIKQIACLQETLTASFSSAKKHNSINEIQKVSQNGSILQHLLVASESSEKSSERLCGQDFSMEQILYKVFKSVTFSQSLSTQTCFIPQIARNLINQDQFKIAFNYLSGIGASNMGIEHTKMICLTQIAPKSDLNNLQTKAELLRISSLFKKSADLILQYSQQADNIQGSIQDILLFQDNSQELRAILAKISEQISDFEFSNKASQLILTSATELSSERVWKQGAGSQAMTAYFLKRALALTPQTYQNYLYQCLFQSQQAFPLLQHWAVNRIQYVDTRQAYLLRFVLGIFRKEICIEQRISYLAKCTFAHDDITLLIEALQQKIRSKFKEILTEEGQSTYSHRFVLQTSWISEMQHLIEVYWQVAQIYEWKDQFCQFVWSCHENSLLKLLNRISTSTPNNDQMYLSLVKLDAHLLGIASTAIYTCGSHFQFASGSEEAENNAQKRSTSEKTVDFGGDQNQNMHNKRWQSRNQWTMVNANKIHAAQLVAQARIECAQVTQSDCSDKLAKILSEMGKFDLAIDLAITCGQNPAYPLATQLFDIQDDQSNESYKKLQIQRTIEQRINLIEDRYLVNVAQALIGLQIKLPESLVFKIIESNQISQVVGCLLSEEIRDAVQATKLVSQSEKAAKNLLQSDANTFVLLLQQAQVSQGIYQNLQSDLQAQILNGDPTKLGGFQSKRKFAQGGDRSGLAILDDALGDQRDIIKELVADRDQEADSSDEEDQATKILTEQLQKCKEDLNVLTEGIQKIKQAVM